MKHLNTVSKLLKKSIRIMIKVNFSIPTNSRASSAKVQSWLEASYDAYHELGHLHKLGSSDERPMGGYNQCDPENYRIPVHYIITAEHSTK